MIVVTIVWFYGIVCKRKNLTVLRYIVACDNKVSSWNARMRICELVYECQILANGCPLYSWRYRCPAYVFALSESLSDGEGCCCKISGAAFESGTQFANASIIKENLAPFSDCGTDSWAGHNLHYPLTPLTNSNHASLFPAVSFLRMLQHPQHDIQQVATSFDPWILWDPLSLCPAPESGLWRLFLSSWDSILKDVSCVL